MWNINLKKLIEQTNETYWPNWNLNNNIKPGAIGILSTDTGTFNPLDDLGIDLDLEHSPLNSNWSFCSSEVKKEKVKSTISADNDELGMSTGIKWKFNKAGQVLSIFGACEQVTLKKHQQVIENNIDKLKQLADKHGHLSKNNHITEGFCVITDVIYSYSGINFGCQHSGESLTITGEVHALEKFFSGNIEGSYSNVSIDQTSCCQVWPSRPNEISNTKIPVAYVVTSFYDDLPIPGWFHQLNTFELEINNCHGGTYIANAELTYCVNGKIKRDKVSVSGGMRTAIGNIPPNATDLQCKVKCNANKLERTFRWSSPLEWPKNSRRIDIKGVWPGKPSFSDRCE